jgi:uncharacterized protein (DUF2336 family)
MVLDLNNINEKSTVLPALVRLYDSQKMIDLAQDHNPTARNELTEIITSLLEIDLSVKESELVADVLISLMRQIENDLRIAIAERLSVMESVPLRLALHLANDEIHTAEPILKKSKVFSDLDLIYIIKSKTADYWRAIAQREEMSQIIMDTLIDTGDLGTAIKLVENEDIELDGHALNALVTLAKGDDRIAAPLLRREEITEDIVKTLYQSVSIALKHYIREEFQMFESDVSHAIDDIGTEFVEAASYEAQIKQSSMPTESHIKVAEYYKAKGHLSIDLMIKTLKRGQYASFIAQFAIYIDLSHKMVRQIIEQKSGQGLAVACRASEIARSDFISIYLLATRLRTKGGMVDIQDLNRATEYFDKINREVALEILKSSRSKR